MSEFLSDGLMIVQTERLSALRMDGRVLWRPFRIRICSESLNLSTLLL